MFRLLFAMFVSAVALLLSSCCCMSKEKAPELRPLPQFKNIPTAPVEVEYTK